MGQRNDNTKGKKWEQITEEQRYKIEAWLEARHKPAGIAKMIKKNPRTIKREIAMGSVIQRDSELRENLVYKADYAQMVHEQRAANKGRSFKIGHEHALVRHIEQKIGKESYSPDAVIGEIKVKGIEFSVTICTKTVYNMIGRGFFLNITNKDLPVKKDGKKRDYHKIRKVALNNKTGRSISERSEIIDKREEAGHWEMDLVVGSTKPCLLVMTERVYRKELIFRINSKEQSEVVAVLDRLEHELAADFSSVFKSFTTDNGGEFLNSAMIERSCLHDSKKRTELFYAHPYSSWERGSNENANRLIRRFIPKGADIGAFSMEDIKRIEHWINNYPRRIFNYKSANDMYNRVA